MFAVRKPADRIQLKGQSSPACPEYTGLHMLGRHLPDSGDREETAADDFRCGYGTV